MKWDSNRNLVQDTTCGEIVSHVVWHLVPAAALSLPKGALAFANSLREFGNR